VGQVPAMFTAIIRQHQAPVAVWTVRQTAQFLNAVRWHRLMPRRLESTLYLCQSLQQFAILTNPRPLLRARNSLCGQEGR
jgi:hypothetical protein